MVKGQVDIVSAVIIILIALSLTSSALMWGLPLIQKRQDTAMVTRAHNFFTRELLSKIKSVASIGGTEKASLDIKGIWKINTTKNAISFMFFSKVSDKATGMWVGEGCDPDKGFTGEEGKLGEEPCIVCALATEAAGGYEITYEIGCRTLNTTEGKKYKIEFVRPAGGLESSTGKDLILSRRTIDTSNPTLIITKIEILLL